MAITLGFISSSNEERNDILDPEVLDKYLKATQIVNRALNAVFSRCKPNAKVADICKTGDAFITEHTANIFQNDVPIRKGIALQTSVAVNSKTIWHFLPVIGRDDLALKKGDIVKIALGCYIDDAIVVVERTHILQDNPVKGRGTQVVAVAYTPLSRVVRLIEPEHEDMYEAIRKAAGAYIAEA